MTVIKELLTPEVCTIYPYLFTKTKMAKNDTKMGYSATLLLDKSDEVHKEWVSNLRRSCFEMMKEAFPYLDEQELLLWAKGRPTNIVQDQLVKPFTLIKNGDAYNEKKGGKYPHFVGKYTMQVKAADRHDQKTKELLQAAIAPAVVDAKVNPILDQSKVYGGCFGIFSIKLRTYGGGQGKDDTGYSAGVTCDLMAFQKTRDGEPIGGAGPVNPKSIFQPIANTTEEDYGSVTGEAADEGYFDEE